MKSILLRVLFRTAFFPAQRTAHGLTSKAKTETASCAAIMPSMPHPVPISSTRSPSFTSRFSAKRNESSAGSYTFSSTTNTKSPKKTRLVREGIRQLSKISGCKLSHALLSERHFTSNLLRFFFSYFSRASQEGHKRVTELSVALRENATDHPIEEYAILYFERHRLP